MSAKTRDEFRRARPVVERVPQVARDIPLGEQIELAAQQRLVVRRQHAFARGELPADQRVDRVEVQRVGVAGVERAR